MKFGCFLSIFGLFLNFLQFQDSDAVTCIRWSQIDLLPGSEKYDAINKEYADKFQDVESKVDECADACAIYLCIINQNLMLNGQGCPNDFYDLCSRFTIAVKEVKERGPNNLDYHNDVFTVYYSSGCGSEIDGRQCILDK
uniref:Uncharacterized protein n=1 Tax=Panagrolaimus sp. ES5 TaxID=591445 RepID=A0AC34FD18_9BILA